MNNPEFQLTGKIDGHPVAILAETQWSYWVTSLDNELIITDEPFGFKGAQLNGFVLKERVTLDDQAPAEDGCGECPWDHDSSYCHECIERAL